MKTSPHLATTTERDPRWASVVARDPRADGTFYYSVATTGVYCRPSCAARLAKPKNVAFHATPADAERAGFRPCRRCKPTEPPLAQVHARLISQICRVLEAADAPPPLAALAARVGLSPYHFHRVFKTITGVTPRAYAASVRARRVQTELSKRGATVTEAVYGAGFNSAGRFYDPSNSRLGMTPSAYRLGGAKQRIHFAVGDCSLGSVLVAQTARGVCAILLGSEPEALVRDLQDRFPQAELIGSDASFKETVARVIGMLEAPTVACDLPLDVRGTAFQQRVWRALQKIPVGTTATYSEIARRIGAPQSARAVAQACAANALAVAIPCHRVVRTDGTLSGYRWGVARKRALLRREGAA